MTRTGNVSRWSAMRRNFISALPRKCAAFYGMARPFGRWRYYCRRFGDSKDGRSHMQIAVLGIDLGKNSCSLVGLDGQGTVIKRRRKRPASVVGFTKGLPPCIIAMEACCGAHHLGRLLEAQGHEVRLMSPEYVRPYGAPRRRVLPVEEESTQRVVD